MTLWVVEKYKGKELMVTTAVKRACDEYKLNYRKVLELSRERDEFEVMGKSGAWSFRKAELVKRR